MIEDEPPRYHLRGHRVQPCSPSQLQSVAEALCDVLSLKGKSFSPKQIGLTLNRLEEVGVCIDPIADDDRHPCFGPGYAVPVFRPSTIAPVPPRPKPAPPEAHQQLR